MLRVVWVVLVIGYHVDAGGELISQSKEWLQIYIQLSGFLEIIILHLHTVWWICLFHGAPEMACLDNENKL